MIKSSPMAGVTLCINCIHHIMEHDSRGPEFSNIWYNNHCNAAPKEIEIDFVYGTRRESAPLCRKINPDGKCKYYERKPDPDLTLEP